MSGQGDKLRASMIAAALVAAVACDDSYRVGANFDTSALGQQPADSSAHGGSSSSDAFGPSSGGDPGASNGGSSVTSGGSSATSGGETPEDHALGGARAEASTGGARAETSSAGANDTPSDGGSPSDSANPSAGGAGSEGGSPPMEHWEPVGVGGDASATFAEQAPPTCHGTQCASGEVCNPDGGCEAACEVVGGVDPNAPWPLSGGCSTRRGQSRFAGARTAKELWRLDAQGMPSTFQTYITLGASHTTYTAFSDYSQHTIGFLQLSPSGHEKRRFEERWSPCPILAEDDVLLTVPGGLSAQTIDGTHLWEVYSDNGPANDSGEPAVGADGTIYVAGGLDQGGHSSIFAVSKQGSLAWSFQVPDPYQGLLTWPAIARDGTIYFGDMLGTLYALSPAGNKLWSVPNVTSGRPSVSPDGNIYTTYQGTISSVSADGQLRWQVDAFDPEDSELGEVAIGPDHTVYVRYIAHWGNFENGVQAYTPGGNLKWQFSRSGSYASAPVIDRDGIIYVGLENNAYALNPDGSELWEYPQKWAAGIAIGSDGTTYLASQFHLTALHEHD